MCSNNNRYNYTNGHTKDCESSIYYDIDSTFRNRELYPNSCDFVVPIQTSQSNTLVDPVLLSTPYSFATGTPTKIRNFTGTSGIWLELDLTEIDIDNFYIGSYLKIDLDMKKIL